MHGIHVQTKATINLPIDEQKTHWAHNTLKIYKIQTNLERKKRQFCYEKEKRKKKFDEVKWTAGIRKCIEKALLLGGV